MTWGGKERAEAIAYVLDHQEPRLLIFDWIKNYEIALADTLRVLELRHRTDRGDGLPCYDEGCTVNGWIGLNTLKVTHTFPCIQTRKVLTRYRTDGAS